MVNSSKWIAICFSDFNSLLLDHYFLEIPLNSRNFFVRENIHFILLTVLPHLFVSLIDKLILQDVFIIP